MRGDGDGTRELGCGSLWGESLLHEACPKFLKAEGTLQSAFPILKSGGLVWLGFLPHQPRRELFGTLDF